MLVIFTFCYCGTIRALNLPELFSHRWLVKVSEASCFVSDIDVEN